VLFHQGILEFEIDHANADLYVAGSRIINDHGTFVSGSDVLQWRGREERNIGGSIFCLIDLCKRGADSK